MEIFMEYNMKSDIIIFIGFKGAEKCERSNN